jgi:hypothetical protein
MFSPRQTLSNTAGSRLYNHTTSQNLALTKHAFSSVVGKALDFSLSIIPFYAHAGQKTLYSGFYAFLNSR